MIEKMKLESQDVAAQKREELKQLFPSVFTETKNEQGELVESVDFEKLKAAVGEFSDLFESRRERYGKDWPGRNDSLRLIQQLSSGALLPNAESSVEFDTTNNVFVEGDNLETLKLLQKSYYGSVKLIYIDPPYNTGHEFIYPDDYSEGLATYLEFAGLVDDTGKKFSTNAPTEGRFHTRWLNMMYPRMYLARNLLAEGGSIWISIDDNELENTLALGKQIFGEENFVATFLWEKRTTRENRRVFSFNHDYIVCFAKNKDTFQAERKLLPFTEETKARYKNPDDDPRGNWQSVSLNAQAGHATPAQFYEITGPSGKIHNPPPGTCWRVTKHRLDELIEDNRIWFGKDGNNVPRRKVFFSEANDGLTPHTLWKADEVGTNDSAKKALIKLFDSVAVYDTPKPVELIERIIQISTDPSSDDIILDYFAGSATTGHATISCNSKDGGNRRFILVQLPEPTPDDSDAKKNGYETISQIGIERLLRTKADAQEANAIFEGQQPDMGLRVFRLDESCFSRWNSNLDEGGEAAIVTQLELQVDHINPDRNEEDILFELLLKAGQRLSQKFECLELSEKRVYAIEENTLLICLEDEITQELLDEVVKLEPIQFICLDKAFQGNDQLKANAVQTFSAHNHGRDKADQIIFRTV